MMPSQGRKTHPSKGKFNDYCQNIYCYIVRYTLLIPKQTSRFWIPAISVMIYFKFIKLKQIQKFKFKFSPLWHFKATGYQDSESDAVGE